MCISRYFGLFVGYLNVVCYSICGILSTFVLSNINFMREDWKNNADTKQMVQGIAWIALIFFLGMVLISVLLIVGITKKRPRYMLPWLVLSVIVIIGFFILSCIKFSMNIQSTKDFIRSQLTILLQIVLYISIYGLYRQLRATEFNDTRRYWQTSYSANISKSQKDDVQS